MSHKNLQSKLKINLYTNPPNNQFLYNKQSLYNNQFI